MNKLTDQQIVGLYYPIARERGEDNNIPVALILAIIKQESRGDAFAVGQTNDYGLMQITLPALQQFCEFKKMNVRLFDLLFSPEINIMVGTWYLRWVADFLETTDWHKVAQAYNAGVGNVQKGSFVGVAYADKVMQYFAEFETLIK
jgi:soluble lytic murein transglycosylase